MRVTTEVPQTCSEDGGYDRSAPNQFGTLLRMTLLMSPKLKILPEYISLVAFLLSALSSLHDFLYDHPKQTPPRARKTRQYTAMISTMKHKVWTFLLWLPVARGGVGETNEPSLQGGTHTPSSRDGVVLKTRYSSLTRLAFIVGLEGAGHDYILGAFERMRAERNNVGPLVECVTAAPYSISDSMSESPPYYAKARDTARRDMRKLAQQDAATVGSGVLAALQVTDAAVNADGCSNVGLLSYPNDDGSGQVFKYTDLGMLAEVAETEGVDLRVVYLKRAAKDVIIANTRRHVQDKLGDAHKATRRERYMEYMRVLFTDISVMHAMFAEIGAEFVVCHDFEGMGGAEQVSEIANFVAPNPEVQALLEDSLTKVAAPPDDADEEDPFFADVDEVAVRLQHKLDVLESSICDNS